MSFTDKFRDDVVSVVPYVGPVTLELLLPDCVITVSNLYTNAASAICDQHNIDYDHLVATARTQLCRSIQIEVEAYHKAREDKDV